MKISIKLFSNFALYHSPSKFSLGIGEGTSVKGVCRNLNIPGDLPRLILVNGQVVGDETLLKDGDTLSLFSPVAGG
jgi:molybdopterin converting factor small subunit